MRLPGLSRPEGSRTLLSPKRDHGALRRHRYASANCDRPGAEEDLCQPRSSHGTLEFSHGLRLVLIDELGLSYLHVIFTFSLRKTVYGYIRRLHEMRVPMNRTLSWPFLSYQEQEPTRFRLRFLRGATSWHPDSIDTTYVFFFLLRGAIVFTPGRPSDSIDTKKNLTSAPAGPAHKTLLILHHQHPSIQASHGKFKTTNRLDFGYVFFFLLRGAIVFTTFYTRTVRVRDPTGTPGLHRH